MSANAKESTDAFLPSMNCGSCKRPMSLHNARGLVGRTSVGRLLPVWICVECRRMADAEEALGCVLISDVCCHRCGGKMKFRESLLIEDHKTNVNSLMCQVCFETMLKERHPLGYLAPTAKCLFCQRVCGVDQCSQVQCQTEQQRQLHVWVCHECLEKC